MLSRSDGPHSLDGCAIACEASPAMGRIRWMALPSPVEPVRISGHLGTDERLLTHLDPTSSDQDASRWSA